MYSDEYDKIAILYGFKHPCIKFYRYNVLSRVYLRNCLPSALSKQSVNNKTPTINSGCKKVIKTSFGVGGH